MRSHTLGAIICIASLVACKTVRPVAAELSALETNCQEPIALQSFVKPEISCTADGFYANAAEARKHDLAPWIPCNDVEWIDDTLDLFGPGPGEEAKVLDQSTFARIYSSWLATADRFTPDMAAKAFQNLNQPLAFNQGNPILDTALAKSIREMIRSAQTNIVMDAFLIGGTWGADIMHELAAAADRGVEVIVLHDGGAKFTVASELDPLWQATEQFSLKHPRFLALDVASSAAPAATPSTIADKLGPLVTHALGGRSASRRNDQSRLLIVDSLHTRSIDEYLHMKPRALISARPWVDSYGSFSPGETVIMRGPSAVVALLNYQSDLRAAWEQARKTKKVNAEDDKLWQSLSARLDQLRSTPTLVKGQGWVRVQPLEVSAVTRNLDTGIIAPIMAAEHSIELYGTFAYNWPLALALKEAMARGVKVRVILDQHQPLTALGNAALPHMLMEAPRRLFDGRETKELVDDNKNVLKESDLPIRWFLPFRPGKGFSSKDRSDLSQPLQARTIIVDSRLALFGSADLDELTWATGFREFAIWVDDPALAAESARQFDRLWNHPLLTLSHKAWMGEELPPPATAAYLQGKQKAAGCDPAGELCRLDTILQGGKALADRAPKRELVKQVLTTETDQLRLLIPAKVLQNDQGRPQCRRL